MHFVWRVERRDDTEYFLANFGAIIAFYENDNIANGCVTFVTHDKFFE